MNFDKDKAKSYFQRVFYNLDLYHAEHNKNKALYKYEVSNLLTALTSLLTCLNEEAIQELFKDNNLYIDDKISTIKQYDNETKNSSIIRHLRNSLAHINFLNNIETNKDDEIEKIRFIDEDKKKKSTVTFDCTLNISDIKNVINTLGLEISGNCINW